MKMKKLYFLVSVFFIFGQNNLIAQELSLGIGYPYFSVKYHPLELKYATGEGIDVFAGRFYWNFYNENRIKGFTGIEAGHINFDTLDIKGSGYEGSLFIAGEYFITNKLSVMLDFSPTFIDIKSDDGYKTDNFAMVINFAVYYYFSEEEKNNPASVRKNKSPSLDKKNETIFEKVNMQELTDIEKKSLMRKHFSKATQLYSEGEYVEAIAEWEKVLNIDPYHELSKYKIKKAKGKIAEE